MTFHDHDDDADDDWDDDPDLSDEGESDDEGDDESTVSCPFCRREIFEDSPRCPHCERYLSAEDFARSGKPLWVIVTAVICLAVAIWLAFVAF
jgi:uncharacterized paraquat-inducible protein A